MAPPSFLSILLALAASVPLCAEGIPGQMVTEAVKCFDNKFIYNGCESGYRLNPSGSFNVPPEATGLFCNGPCLIETQLVLDCLDDAFGNFLFYNKATAQDIRDALHVGCSYSSQRGNFNPGWFIQGEISKAYSFQNVFTYSLLLVVGSCLLILYHK